MWENNNYYYDGNVNTKKNLIQKLVLSAMDVSSVILHELQNIQNTHFIEFKSRKLVNTVNTVIVLYLDSFWKNWKEKLQALHECMFINKNQRAESW